MFPFSIRNIFFTWASLRPWVQSLIKGIPGWPLVILICIIGSVMNALLNDLTAAVFTSLFIIMWYGAVWAMGQQDIRQLTFKSSRAWFIAAIVIFLGGMTPAQISIPLLAIGAYLIYAWDSVIAAKKIRYTLIGSAAIILVMLLNSAYPGKFMLSYAVILLPTLVVLIAPKQVDRLISWVYSVVSLGVVAFFAIAAVADKVPEKDRVGIISAIVLVTAVLIFWAKFSSKGKLLNAAHQEKKAASVNSPSTRKFRRWLFMAVTGAYVVAHGIVVAGMRGGDITDWLVVLAGAGFVYALWHRLDTYDEHHSLTQAS